MVGFPLEHRWVHVAGEGDPQVNCLLNKFDVRLAGGGVTPRAVGIHEAQHLRGDFGGGKNFRFRTVNSEPGVRPEVVDKVESHENTLQVERADGQVVGKPTNVLEVESLSLV